jgi:copper homeostasis protein
LEARILIEVAVGGVEGARVAHECGADRIELNAGLELGGLTPSLGALLEVRSETPLPVITMVRPRAGGFVYSADEFRTMERDVELMLEHGAEGVAFGVLTADGKLDLMRTRALSERVGRARRDVVFHRAFDRTPDPFTALDQLIDLGVRRVLTSGQRASAVEGADLIRRLIEHARGRIEVLPGAGIRAGNVAELVRVTGAGQVHGSFSERRVDPAGPVGEGGYVVTSARELRETRGALARL